MVSPYVGLRPGEKLYEELQHTGENKVMTQHNKIMILKDNKAVAPWIKLKLEVSLLINISKTLDSDKIQLKLRELIPTYIPQRMIVDFEKDKIPNIYSIKGEA